MRLFALIDAVACLAFCGCATTDTSTAGGDAAHYSADDQPDAGIEVPDVGGVDGTDAVTSVEDAGLTGTLAAVKR